jgi:hypothetical protein
MRNHIPTFLLSALPTNSPRTKNKSCHVLSEAGRAVKDYLALGSGIHRTVQWNTTKLTIMVSETEYRLNRLNNRMALYLALRGNMITAEKP